MSGKKPLRAPHDPRLLGRGDRRQAGREVRTGFHLNKRQRPATFGDQVNFTRATASCARISLVQHGPSGQSEGEPAQSFAPAAMALGFGFLF